MAQRQKRFEVLAERPINKDGFIKEWPEVGLVAMESPNDPRPSITIRGGRIVELDGRPREDFDMIDAWIADHCINAADVPGVLFTSRPTALSDPSLKDLAPSILKLFGVAPEREMGGRSIY